MILSECSDDFPKSYLNYEGTLDSPDMPAAVKECAGPSVIAAWAIGGQVLVTKYIVQLICTNAFPYHCNWHLDKHMLSILQSNKWECVYVQL